MANSFMNMTGIANVAHTVATKLASLTTDNTGKDKGKEAARVKGLLLALNGKTALENFLLGKKERDTGRKFTLGRKTTVVEREASEASPGGFGGQWGEEDLEIAQGVLSDDGSGIRR